MENFNPDLRVSDESAGSLNNIIEAMELYIGTLLIQDQQLGISDSQNCNIKEFTKNLLEENIDHKKWMSTDPEEIKTRYYEYNEKYKKSLTVVN